MSITEIAVGIPTATWRLDPVHSAVGFEVSYLAGTFKGQFREAAAELRTLDGRASLDGSAKVTSVDVKDENLAAHLQSPEFFDAERHPDLRFTAHDIALDGATVAGRGEITIKGVTEIVEVDGTVAAPIVDAYGNDRIGLTLSATVDRRTFGLNWNMPLPSGDPALANEVHIVAELQFVKAA